MYKNKPSGMGRRKKPVIQEQPVEPAEKFVTIQECEEAFERAAELCALYMKQTVERKFGGYQQAARGINKTRPHIYANVNRTVGLDTMRRTARLMAFARKEIPWTYGKVLTPRGYIDAGNAPIFPDGFQV